MSDDPAAALAAGLSDGRCLHHLVAGWVTSDPGRIAVVSESRMLSYAELDRHASQLAHLVLRLAPDRPAVGLLLSRSADFVVAALAVLKAGGFYVPLDPGYPEQRLRFMLTTAGCALVISTTALVAALPPGLTIQAVCLDSAAPSLATLPASGPARWTEPEDLAYVMFTSGSTGAPKGVMITHRGVVRLAQAPGAKLGPSDAVLHASSVSFDAATFDIWGALAHGARLVIAPPGRLSTMALATLLREQRVTTALLPTGLFHLMVDERLPGLAGVRQLLTGGDVLSTQHAQRFLQAVPDCTLINAYGPTEVTVATTVHAVSPGENYQSVPIGRPLPGTYIRLLDPHMRPVSQNMPGQLYAGGAGLARGYIGDPALTAQRFIPDPWLPGARLYATGDLAMERPDGALEFLGRIDGQIKKRGFRIEPGEVEAALRADPGVRDAAVTADGRTAETRRLVAVLIPVDGQLGGDLLSRVRARLRVTLPSYMAPDVLALADELPLTANGKVDREALRQLAVGSAGEQQERLTKLAPENAFESLLTRIWQDILGVGRIGRDDDFFEVGGHSLLANKVVSQIHRDTGIELPLEAVFDYPTIAELADVLQQNATWLAAEQTTEGGDQ